MGNMNLVTGYQGTDHVTAADHGSLYAGIFGEGNYVLNRGGKFAATVVTSNRITIADGDLILQGRHIRVNTGQTVSLTVTSGTQGYNRKDLIVARYTRNASTGIEQANLVVVKGTAVTGTASDPATNAANNLLTGNATTVDFPLYRIPISGISVGTPEQLFSVVETPLADVGGKSIRLTAYLTTTWVGSSAPYTQVLSNSAIEADSVVEISLASSASVTQAEAYMNLGLQDGGQTDGSLTLRCFGDKNTVTIPLNIVIRRD